MNLIIKYRVLIVIVFALSMFIKPEICFLILGGITSYAGIESILFLNKIKKRGIKLTGNIVDYQSDNEGLKTPVIEFTALTGESIREKPYAHASSNIETLLSSRKQTNQSVSILYDPENPKKFVLANREDFNYFIFFIFIVAGAFFAGLSIASFLGYINIF